MLNVNWNLLWSQLSRSFTFLPNILGTGLGVPLLDHINQDIWPTHLWSWRLEGSLPRDCVQVQLKENLTKYELKENFTTSIITDFDGSAPQPLIITNLRWKFTSIPPSWIQKPSDGKDEWEWGERKPRWNNVEQRWTTLKQYWNINIWECDEIRGGEATQLYFTEV